MRLTIQRGSRATALARNPHAMMFAVSFRLTLSPEEQRWAERMSLHPKFVSWPEACPTAPNCGTPRWSLRDVLGGVHFEPAVSRTGDSSYLSLRQVLHAEEDVRHGCTRLARTLEDAQGYHGIEEVFFGESRAEPAG